MTGNPVGAPIGEISEVIGKAEVLKRLEDSCDFFTDIEQRGKK